MIRKDIYTEAQKDQYMTSSDPFHQLKVSIALIALHNCVQYVLQYKNSTTKHCSGVNGNKNNKDRAQEKGKVEEETKRNNQEWKEKLEREEIKRL